MIRSTKIELYNFSPERRERWLELARDVQGVTNLLWSYWLVYHTLVGSGEQIKTDIKAFHDWTESGGKKSGNPKPKWKATPFPETDWQFSCQKQARRKNGQPDSEPVQNPPDLRNDLYHLVVKKFPCLSSHTVSLIWSAWASELTTRKSSRGSIKGWAAILLFSEQVPTFTKPLPIPIDKSSALKKAPIVVDGENYFLNIAIERDGKTIRDSCQLMINKRKARSTKAIVKRIVSGEYDFRGSKLVYQKGKWFVSIAYEMPEQEAVSLNKDSVIELIPAVKSTWILRKNGKPWRAFGRGVHVTRFRSAIQNERWTRQEHYRWAGSNAKGHGSKRAKAAFTKLSSRWRNFTKNYNNEVTRKIVDKCIENKIGKIVFHQPKDGRRDNLFLAKSGKHEKSRMTWDWFQVGTMLKYKAAEYGIEVEIKDWSKQQGKEAVGTGVVRALRKNNQSKSKRRTGRKKAEVLS